MQQVSVVVPPVRMDMLAIVWIGRDVFKMLMMISFHVLMHHVTPRYTDLQSFLCAQAHKHPSNRPLGASEGCQAERSQHSSYIIIT